MCIHERISLKNKKKIFPLETCVNWNKNDEGVKENEWANWNFKKKCKEEKLLHYDEAALFESK